MNNDKKSITAFLYAGLLLAGLAFLSPISANAQDPGMEPMLPGNPLTRMMSGLNPANWNLPKMKMPSIDKFLPTKQEKERVITKKDSLVTEVSQTAKQSWQRTKDTLNPMKLIPAGFKQISTTTPTLPSEGGFFSRLFSGGQPKQKQTVNDWLKQEPVR